MSRRNATGPLTGSRLVLAASVAVLLLSAVGLAARAHADTEDAAFHRGNEAYLKGDYDTAIAAYEQVAELGMVHEALFYNLGNAYYRAGQLGRAIFALERARLLDPTDDDIEYNLATARNAAARAARDRLEGAEEEPLWQRLAGRVTVAQATWSFVGLYWLFFGVLVALRFLPAGLGRTGIKVGNAFVAAAVGTAAVLLAARIYLTEGVAQAIILPDSVEVKEGPDPNYKTSFRVHAGLKVRSVERDQEWTKVRLANGLDGWMRDVELGKL
jgi:tetratricopeptide (TPR) repeat protein